MAGKASESSMAGMLVAVGIVFFFLAALTSATFSGARADTEDEVASWVMFGISITMFVIAYKVSPGSKSRK